MPPRMDAISRSSMRSSKEAAPDMLVLGPGSVGESTGDWALAYGNQQVLNTRDLLMASGPGIDALLLSPLWRRLAALHGHGQSNDRRGGFVRGVAAAHG